MGSFRDPLVNIVIPYKKRRLSAPFFISVKHLLVHHDHLPGDHIFIADDPEEIYSFSGTI